VISTTTTDPSTSGKIQTARTFSRSGARTGKARFDAPPSRVGARDSLLICGLPNSLPFLTSTGHALINGLYRQSRRYKQAHPVTAQVQREIRLARQPAARHSAVQPGALARARAAKPKDVIVQLGRFSLTTCCTGEPC